MVQRAACSSSSSSSEKSTSASLNGVRNGGGGTSGGIDVAITDAVITASVPIGGERNLLARNDGGRGGRFSLFRWFKRHRDTTVEKRRRTSARSDDDDNDDDDDGIVRRRSSVYSSVESVDTFYSTTTVRSFAFHSGTVGRCNVLSLDILKQAAEVGPFAAGASKVLVGNKENTSTAVAAYTLPTNVHSKRRDITARYSLHPSTTFASSCDNLPTSGKGSSIGTSSRGPSGSARRRVHVKGKRKAPNPPGTIVKIVEVDVRETPRNSGRRKRRAPRPPERLAQNPSTEEQSRLAVDGGMEVEDSPSAEIYQRQSISNDTLVLQGGMLLSKKEVSDSPKAARNSNDDASGTSNVTILRERAQSPPVGGTLGAATPRPWYKRGMFEHTRDSGPSRKGAAAFRSAAASSSVEVKDECATNVASSTGSASVDASLSRLSFFHRGERQSDERKRQEAKRRSGLSILTNISELDKEAAAIVQEEQARTRASMLLKTSKFTDPFDVSRNDVNEEIVQDMVASAMESSSPRRGTRALISKFNAISNITKVTVNANFFARRDQSDCKHDRDATRNSRFERIGDWRNQRFPVQRDLGQSVRVDKDISKYFLPQQQQQQQQRASRSKTESTTQVNVKLPIDLNVTLKKRQNDQLMKDTSSRISFLQSQLAANRANEPATIQDHPTSPITNEERIRLRREIVEVATNEQSPRLNDNVNGKFLFSRNLPESTENALDSFGTRTEGNGERLGGGEARKEFTDIFEVIDRQLRTREFKLIERRPAVESDNVGTKVPGDEATVSSKVAKVLDILVEAEKDGKTRSVSQPERSILDKESPRLIDTDRRTKSGKTKSTALNTVEDPITADLKEMLKEMKHSLPKRIKPKKPVSGDVLEKVEKLPPVSTNKASYVASHVATAKTEATSPNDYETDKQKVSSSAQTSGNIRRLNQPSTSAERASTSAWKHENVLYRTSGKGSALVKNTFQLIRPRDFAEIEAMKTTNEVYKENTYANVMEPSLYANARVTPASPKQRPAPPRFNDIPQSSRVKVTPNIANDNKIMSNENEPKEEDDNLTARNMNTLAINRLLRKLEGAIASGHHQQAAGLAKELARLKIHCSVIRQRSAARLKDQSIKVNMYIEDKLAHQGPIPLELPTGMTVAELKTKIHTEFEIPTNVQRWIIGKNLADRDEATLDELHAMDGSPVFLYLVAPEFHVDNPAQTGKSKTARDKVPEELPQDPPTEASQTVHESQDTVEREEVISAINESEQETAEADISEDIKMGRYEELISLENWDVIPNSEPIECPICFVTYGPREGVILRDCLHMFCRPCIANTIVYCEEAEVKCPYRDSEYTCESTLQEREIKALVEPEIYQQHLAKSIAQAENNAGNKAFHCKTPDCPGWCIYDDDVNNFLCPVCGANNCLTCQVVHTGKNCKQYQQELQLSKETDQESRRTAAMLKEMVDKGEALACPTCAVVLIKKWGCDWLVCSMCKTEICWVTKGPRWGPGGKGDTSGGCRCGENGVKCHPRCNYCH